MAGRPCEGMTQQTEEVGQATAERTRQQERVDGLAYAFNKPPRLASTVGRRAALPEACLAHLLASSGASVFVGLL
ncbi:unnamed protein product [Urochloa humidicola]